MNWIVDRELVRRANESESVQLVDARGPDGNRILLIVATGATAGLLLTKLIQYNILAPNINP